MQDDVAQVQKITAKSAFYDFAVSPYSYDFATFVIAAKARGCSHFVFVPGERAYQKLNKTQQRERLHRILLPLVGNYTVCETRDQARQFWSEDCYPIGYTVDKPVNGHMLIEVTKYPIITPFRAAQDAVEYVSTKLGNLKPIVITIRQTMREERNSNLSDWIAFAEYAEMCGHKVIFIPDTDAKEQNFYGFESWPEAADDVHIRMALMQAAMLNMGIPNGPLCIALYSAMPYLCFRPITPEHVETSKEYWISQGIPPGSQPTWFNKGQRLIWNDDKIDVLKRAFSQWLEVQNGAKWPAHELPVIPLLSASTDAKRSENMAIAVSKIAKRIEVAKSVRPEAISIVCYGPSLKDTWQDIERPIMSVSGAHDFLIERGIVPDYHVDSDPRAHKAEFTKNPHKDVRYLMASCCDPQMWENLAGHDVSLWHSLNNEVTARWVEANDPTGPIITGGSTVGLRAIELAGVMGFNRFRIFGMDSCYRGEETHAGAHNGKFQRRIKVSVTENGYEYLTSPQLIGAAREFIDYVSSRPIRSMRLFGNGLMQEMYYQSAKMYLDSLKAAA